MIRRVFESVKNLETVIYFLCQFLEYAHQYFMNATEKHQTPQKLYVDILLNTEHNILNTKEDYKSNGIQQTV